MYLETKQRHWYILRSASASLFQLNQLRLHRVWNFRSLKTKYDLTLCQSRLHTASETSKKYSDQVFDFLHFRMHFDRKEWGIRKNWKKSMRKFQTRCAMTFTLKSGTRFKPYLWNQGSMCIRQVCTRRPKCIFSAKIFNNVPLTTMISDGSNVMHSQPRRPPRCVPKLQRHRNREWDQSMNLSHTKDTLNTFIHSREKRMVVSITAVQWQ